MRKEVCSLALIALSFFFPKIGFSAKFSNQFVEFELPPQWQCNLEGAEWVCQSLNAAKKRDAIVVLAAKIKGNQDSLDQYLTYLKGSKSFTNFLNRPMKSDPKYARTTNINGQDWVDSLHYESEIPGFYTRYLVTVKQDIGVLVSYSINKAKYQQYLDDFDTMIKTLRVFRKAGGINTAPQNANLFQNTQIATGAGTETIFPGASHVQGGSDSQENSKKPKQEGDSSILLFIGVIALAGYFFIKRRKP